MDLGNLGISESAIGRPVTITPLGDDGSPVILSNGQAFAVRCHMPNTVEGRRVYGAKRARAAEGDAEAEVAADRALLVAAVIDWNLVDAKGKAVEPSDENKSAFFAHFAQLRFNLSGQLAGLMVALGNGKPA